MKNKKPILAVLCILLIFAVLGAVGIGLRAVPTANYALRIAELLKPMLAAENQRMRIDISISFDGREMKLERDIFWVTEDGISYLATEQDGAAVYMAGNVLFLENGKAFRLGDKLQAGSQDSILSHIGTLYEVLNITAEETESETAYSVTVTGEQIHSLLEAVSPGNTLPAKGIETLNLCLTEEKGTLKKITCSGSGTADGTPVSLHVTLSGFRVLAPGDYPIPAAVKQSAATVDPEGLFSLTEDLYRLVLALAPLADSDPPDGTLTLAADCGPIQVDTEIQLSDLKAASGGHFDPETLRALPEMLSFVCMEGDIRCTQTGTSWVYTLKLDQQGMQELIRMMLPALSQYGCDPTEGCVTVTLEGDTVASMVLSIEGKISTMIMDIPLKLDAEFVFG